MKAKLWSGILFVAGMVTFITTASFGTDPLERPTGLKPLFVVVALFPSVVYMVNFWMMLLGCSSKHRKLRNLRKRTLPSKDGKDTEVPITPREA